MGENDCRKREQWWSLKTLGAWCESLKRVKAARRAGWTLVDMLGSVQPHNLNAFSICCCAGCEINCSGVRVALVSALSWCQHGSDISQLLVSAFLWYQHFPDVSISPYLERDPRTGPPKLVPKLFPSSRHGPCSPLLAGDMEGPSLVPPQFET
jgi:hypothetical protein